MENQEQSGQVQLRLKKIACTYISEIAGSIRKLLRLRSLTMADLHYTSLLTLNLSNFASNWRLKFWWLMTTNSSILLHPMSTEISRANFENLSTINESWTTPASEPNIWCNSKCSKTASKFNSISKIILNLFKLERHCHRKH